MFKKRAAIILIMTMMISFTYIFALDQYDSMLHTIEWLNEKISLEDVHYAEIGIELKGINYNEPLTLAEVTSRQEEMISQLGHEADCSKLCQLQHLTNSKEEIKADEKALTASACESGLDWNYEFTVKNQEDIHRNTYYDLKIKGEGDIAKLDTLRNWGLIALKKWEVETEETIYFKGSLAGMLTKERSKALKEKVFSELDAYDTNIYEDDLCETTCAYYGYTPHVKSYIKEDGQKTNVQMSFKYDEEKDCTEIVVAFPFYNEPF